MNGYTKLFCCIIASTVWRESNETRIVWITMLALANKHGVVESSLPGLADMARVSIADCETALVALEAPDHYSRTKEFEGRRIRPCEGGWLVLNHAKYRAKMGADERREYLRLKQQEHRAKTKAPVNTLSTSELTNQHCQHNAEAETKADAKAIPPQKTVRAVAPTTDEWLESLKKNPTYTGIDIDRERGKAATWCEANNRQPTRRFFVNWLNRADKPIPANGTHSKSHRAGHDRNAGTLNDPSDYAD